MMTEHYLKINDTYCEKYGDKVAIVYQVGSFYEIYGDKDIPGSYEKLLTLKKVCGFEIAKKPCVKQHPNLFMVGFPLQSYEKFVHMLIQAGYTVVRLDQEKRNGCFERVITDISSPGVNMNSTTLDTNNLMSVYLEERQVHGKIQVFGGVSVLDIRTAESYVYELNPSVDDNQFVLNEVFRLVQAHNPSELIVHVKDGHSQELQQDHIVQFLELHERTVHFNFYRDEKWMLNPTFQKNIFSTAFPETGMLDIYEYLDLVDKKYAQLSYIYILQFAYEHNETLISKLKRPQVNKDIHHLILSYDSINQLNIIHSHARTRQSKNDSILSLVNNTSTPVGRRRLKHYLMYPIVCPAELQKRYDLCESMLRSDPQSLDARVYSQVEIWLENIPDIEKLHRRMTLGTLEPNQFCSLDIAYRYIQKLLEYFSQPQWTAFTSLLPSQDVLTQFHAFVNDYSTTFDLERMFRLTRTSITETLFCRGVDSKIDVLQDEIDIHTDYFLSFANAVCQKLGITGHTFKQDKDGEHHFVLTRTRAKTLKKQLVDRQEWTFPSVNNKSVYTVQVNTLEFVSNKKGVCMTSFDIRDHSQKMNSALLKLSKRCVQLYEKVLRQYDVQYREILEDICNFVSYTDFIKSNAKTAFKLRFYKPTICSGIDTDGDESSFVHATNLRHPLIEALNPETEYVANDVDLGQSQKGMLLYGVNAVGKSSYMKSVGISIILAQCGMFVPADTFNYRPFSQLFTRISGNDNIFKAQSTFGREMSELRSIFRRADKNSIVLGDEPCSGTETVSALSLVGAGILELDLLGASYIFTTHLHKLADLPEVSGLQTLRAYHMKTKFDEETNEIVYNRKLSPGKGKDLYGLEVAKGMKMGKRFLARANRIRQRLLNIPKDIIPHKASNYNAKVSLNQCQICKVNAATETHHIKPQRDADADNMFQHHHKNVEHNLIPLCHDCHQQTENGALCIRGYIRTSMGIKVDYCYLDEVKEKQRAQRKKKYSPEQIQKVLHYRPEHQRYWNLASARKQILITHNFKISTSIIKRIWLNQY